MRPAVPSVFAIAIVLCTTLAPPTAAQSPHEQHHAALDARGKRFMGFDQQATMHHFLLDRDGGRIEVTVKDAGDTSSVGQIRDHLRHLAQAFAAADFELPMLVHDTKAVPGIDGMKMHHGSLSFRFEEIGRGARVRLTGRSAEAIAAVHDFLRFQIKDHGTGDPLVVK